MSTVKMGRKWEINSTEDYIKAMETLEDNEFCAMMSDDYFRADAELAECKTQKLDVMKQAIEKGIL